MKKTPVTTRIAEISAALKTVRPVSDGTGSGQVSNDLVLALSHLQDARRHIVEYERLLGKTITTR